MIQPIYKKLLIAAIVLYVIAYCIMQVDLYKKVGNIEHKLLHLSGAGEEYALEAPR